MGRIHKKYYSANATFLSDEVIREIKGSIGVVPDAINTMAKKYHISHSRVVDYIENREREQQMNSRSRIEGDVFYIESQHQNSTPDQYSKKKRSSSKLIHSSHSTSNNGEKISGGGINNIPNTDIVAQIERERKRKDKNLTNCTRIKSTTLTCQNYFRIGKIYY